ncbi:energy transducer TonB family protein [Taibaiella chishuiensis]|uniref:Outer membrane transport energization protein TonB n=1 Tax=Taibaiella chishuiensis TaxID=1434707 RepID=A0A2P8DD21_9BACT|nr:energy transducer TonB [Taibaiella chishuiensis]PSK95118.1 outer membrane transport energization protein TonB [Taibaiella chishuiensis]
MTFEQQKNMKALAWTAGVHLLLILSFLLIKYTLPEIPVMPEMGMEVNLGTSDNGSGNDQPEVPEDPAAAEAAVAVNPAASSDNDQPEVHTSEDNDAPAIVPAHKTPKNKKVAVQPVPDKRQANNKNTAHQANTNKTVTAAQKPRYVYAGANGKGGNSAAGNRPGGNEGIGQGDGDMGVPGGTPGAANYKGTPGNGNGGTSIGHSISGRNIVSRPDPSAEFREGGKVVIRVTVNKDGAITDSRVVSAANATIRALALKKLQSVRFNKSASAPAEQFGNITFEFRATRN